MKKLLVWLLLFLILLTGCGSAARIEPGEGETAALYKIAAVNEYNGTYSVLAYNYNAERPELTFVGVSEALVTDEKGRSATAADLRGGMVIEVIWDGMVAESWPCQIWVERVRVVEQDDDLVGLYRTVLNDLWENDSGLNHDVKLLGLDFSTLTNLTEEEKTALAYLFSCDVGLGLEYVLGTWEELCEKGYIDRENLYWEDGVFLSLKLEETPGETSFTFDAEKWRSGLGAIYFTDCTAKRGQEDRWSYEAGGFAIA